MIKKPVDFSIILPVMNQADHIEKVLRDFHKELSQKKYSFELIPVVNGTTDESFAICQKAAGQLTNVFPYELKEGGYGRAIIHGLKKSHGRNLCYLNSARVYPDELLNCLKIFSTNSKVIIHGVRIKRDLRLRKLSSWIYNTTCQVLTGVKSSDMNGTPKIFSREIHRQLNLQFKDSMIDIELLEKAKKLKAKILEVPIYKNVRRGGKSTSSFKTIFRLIKELFNYWLKTRFSRTTYEVVYGLI